MQAASTFVYMNPDEKSEQNAREDRHIHSQRDIRDIKHQMDVLSSKTGNLDISVKQLVTAIKGNELGTEDGLVSELEKLRADQVSLRADHALLKNRLDAYELSVKTKQMYLLGFFTVVGALLGTLFKIAIDHLFKK